MSFDSLGRTQAIVQGSDRARILDLDRIPGIYHTSMSTPDAYASKLGLKVRLTNVGAQKIDGSTLQTFGMGLVSFQVEDKLGRARSFQETFRWPTPVQK